MHFSEALQPGSPTSRSEGQSQGNVRKFLFRNYPTVLLIVILVLLTAFMQRPVAAPILAVSPDGWTRVLEPGKVLAIEFDEGVVWAGGKDGLFKLDRSTGRSLGRVALPVEPIHIRSLAVDSAGSLWIGHVDGLIRTRAGKFEQWDKRSGLPANRVNALFALEDRVLAGTAAGLAEIKDHAPIISSINEDLASPIVNVVFRSSAGDLWLGSKSDPDGGLVCVRGGEVFVWTTADGLPHPYVQDIAEDDEGRIWVATGQYDEGGALLFDTDQKRPQIVRVLTKSDGLAGEKVRSLGIGSDGSTWFGSESDGLAIETNEGLRVLTMKDGLPHDEVTVVKTDRDGTVWLGGLNGVVRIEQDAARRLGDGKPVS